MRLYAGVGARATPKLVQYLMTGIARRRQIDGWILRSGGADGADLAFQWGAVGQCEIFRHGDCTPEAYQLSGQYHPAWDKCSEDARLKHGRNAMIILGRDLRTPVEEVICWTPGGAAVGGTGQAIRIAQAFGIPVINLADSQMGFDF